MAKYLLLFAVPVFLVFPGCGKSGTRSGGGRVLTDVLGREVPAPPGGARRIVSLSPGVTEILFAVGAGDRVAGVTEYCDYPPEARERVRVGGFAGATVSVERIAVLEPDLVILSGDMHGRILDLLENTGLPAFAVEPRNLGDVYALVRTIGLLTDCETGAEETVRIMEEKIARAALLFRGERPLVYWEVSAYPLISAGKGSFVNDALNAAGGRNIFGDLENSWPLVSGEEVLRRRPDWIMTGDDHDGGFASRPGWGGIPAVRDGRVAAVKADEIYRYGPRLADAVLAIAAVLAGER